MKELNVFCLSPFDLRSEFGDLAAELNVFCLGPFDLRSEFGDLVAEVISLTCNLASVL